jgi:predicted ATPase
MSRLLRLTMRTDRERGKGFPFTVPVIAALETLDLSADVTFFVGENGSGKSTLLEALAIAAELPTAGAAPSVDDPALAAQRELARCLRLAWKMKSRKGFFLRAEDLIGYQRREASTDRRLVREMGESLLGVKAREEGSNPIVEPGWDTYLSKYDGRSHGETFLDFFDQRIKSEGLHLIDEPEAALSPKRQLALADMIHARARKGAQFVIATHSPILLGLPRATIYLFEGAAIRAAAFEELEHVRITRDVLSDRAAFTARFR